MQFDSLRHILSELEDGKYYMRKININLVERTRVIMIISIIIIRNEFPNSCFSASIIPFEMSNLISPRAHIVGPSSVCTIYHLQGY